MGNALEQRQQWNRPEDLTQPQMMFNSTPYYIPLSESPSDLAGQITAALVAGALALNQYDRLDSSTTFQFVRSCCLQLCIYVFQSSLK